MIQILTPSRTGSDPALNSRPHVVVRIISPVSKAWMVEDAYNIIEHLIDRHARVIPCVDDARRDVLEDFGGNRACRLIEDVAKVVFGQKTMRRRSAVRVRPGQVLVFCRGVDDRRRTSLELFGGSCNNGLHVWCKQTHDEKRDPLRNRVYQLFKARNVRDNAVEAFHDAVSKLQDGVDLLHRRFEISLGKGLRDI